MSNDSRIYTEHDGRELTPAVTRVAEAGEPAREDETFLGSETATVGAEEETTPAESGEGVGGHAVEVEPLHPSAAAVLDEVVSHFAAAPAVFESQPSPEFVREHFFEFDYLDRFEEIERYWVNEPYAYITVLYDEQAREYRYHVVEPELDVFEQYVRSDLLTLLRNSLMYLEVEEGEDRETLFLERVSELIERHAATVDVGTLHKVLYYLKRDFLDYGPIDAVMRDRNIEDISCDGSKVPVFVYHREYRDLPTNVSFEERRLNSFTVQLAQRAGKSISVSDPLIDASLPDGSRIQLTLGGEVSTRGSNFTIRKFADIPYTPVDLMNWNTFSVEQMAYFWLAIENNKSLVFAGGTGSGKTTSMNAVSFFIPPVSKVVTIEDTREIDLPHQNWIQSVTRSSPTADGRGEVSMYDLLQAALRQRPEYLLVGEIRTEQRVALTFFQAMGTGHTAYTTIHADSVETAISRLQNPPLSVPAQMIRDLDIVSIQKQTFIGDRRVRRNQVVAELDVDPDDPEAVRIDEVFAWDAATDIHERVGESRVLGEIARERGWDAAELARQLDQRERVLRYLVDNDLTGYDAVASTLHMYAKDPDTVMEAVEAGAFDLPTPKPAPSSSVANDFQTWEEVLATARTADERDADDEEPAESGTVPVSNATASDGGVDKPDDMADVPPHGDGPGASRRDATTEDDR